MKYLTIPAFALLSACAHYDTPAEPIKPDTYTAGKYAPATSPRPVARPVLAVFECVKTDHEKCGDETRGERDYEVNNSVRSDTTGNPDGGHHNGGGGDETHNGGGKPDKGEKPGKGHGHGQGKGHGKNDHKGDKDKNSGKKGGAKDRTGNPSNDKNGGKKGNASANNKKGGNYGKTGHEDNGKGQGRTKGRGE